MQCKLYIFALESNALKNKKLTHSTLKDMNKQQHQNKSGIAYNDLLRDKFMSDIEANKARKARERDVLNALVKSETKGKEVILNNLRK